MTRFILALIAFHISVSALSAQTPSYSKDIRPFLTRYCLECHNARTLKGTLSLETYKALMDGSDGGPVIVAGKPDKSRLVLQCEGTGKPKMPPAKAKFQPTKDEIALLRAWVAAGAKDDGASVKVELPAIKAKVDVMPPVTALVYRKSKYSKFLVIGRGNEILPVFLRNEAAPDVRSYSLENGESVTALAETTPELGPDTIFSATNRIGGNAAVRVEYGGALEGDHPPHTDRILDLVADPRGRWLASASYDTRIHVKEWRGKKFHILKEHSDAVYGLAFNPDGTLLASVSADRSMKVFDVAKGKLLYTLGHATDWLYCVAWSPNGKYLVSGGVDKSIRVYEPTPTGAKLRQSVFAHEGPVLKVVFAGDSRTLYSVGEDRIVKAWDIEKMVERKVYDKQPETVLCLALREDAQQIIVGRYDGIVQLIDMKTGKVVHEFGKTKVEKKKASADFRGIGFQSCLFGDGVTGSESYPTEDGHPGSSPATGQKITPPANIAGTLDRAGAVHFFRFDAKRGQPLGARLTAEGKAKFDPVLILADLSGRILAESYDGHLGHTFAEAGSYAIGVRDRDYRGGADFKYRLQLGEIPVVTSVFPMGMQRGTSGDFHLDGVFLPKKVIAITVPKNAKPGALIPLALGDGVLGKAQITVGEFPEALEGAIPVPGTANGRIARDNQKDLWSFHTKKGERLIVEVNARRLGSRLDSIIEILDKNDQPVPRAVLRSQAKTHVTFRDHDSAQGNIRIETWSELATNDLLYVGNELMKIKELPTHPDADCNFFAADGKRLTYLDTTPTHHANNTPMYKVSVHPPGTIFPPNGFPVFTLYYRNDDGGPGYGRDSRIVFDPPTDGEFKVRIADARGMGSANFGYRLTVRPPEPGFTLRHSLKAQSVPKGSAIPVTITAERIDGYGGPITVGVKSLPAGLHMPQTTIEAGQYATTVALFADAKAQLPAKPLQYLLQGDAIADNVQLGYAQEFELPKLIDAGDIVTTTADSEVAIKPGEQAKLLVRIERRNGFKGRVPLDVKGLPHGVRVLDIGLNGILVNENETTRTIVLYAEPWVPAANRPFVVLAKREGKGTEHAAKSVMLKVK